MAIPKYQPKTRTGAVPKLKPRSQPVPSRNSNPPPPDTTPVVPEYGAPAAARAIPQYEPPAMRTRPGGPQPGPGWQVRQAIADAQRNGQPVNYGMAQAVQNIQELDPFYTGGHQTIQSGMGPGGQPWPTGASYSQIPAYLPGVPAVDQYGLLRRGANGIPQFQGPALVPNPYYGSDDYAQRPSYAEYAYDQNPNLSRGVKENAQRGSGPRATGTGKVTGTKPPATIPAYSGSGGAGGDLGGYDGGGGGGYGGGGGGGYEPPPWYYGLMTWRF